ncbi:MAG: hypothetical protein RJA70_301 [Pseudomonadota bacterium]|jgi:acetolactate synthase-1/2/3 large subunit
MAQVHGGRLVALALRRQGTQCVFTLCGGHIQAIYDGCLDEGIRVVDVRHEQTAGHAADGMARVTGKPGVALVTAGPGVTDVVTALANAQRASVPLVCIGGAGPQAMADMGSLQEMDTVSLMRSVSKWSVRITETRRIVEYIDAAFRIAQSNLPGPVYLEIPLDVLMTFAEDDLPATAPLEPSRPAAASTDIKTLANLVRSAGRPTFIIGSQLHFSPEREIVNRFADKVQVPFFFNGMARGALPLKHPSGFAKTRHKALKESDLIVLMGTPFDFRVDYGRSSTWNPAAKVVQVDLDGEQLGKNRHVDLALHADTGLVLSQLLSELGEKRCPEWLKQLRQLEDARSEQPSDEVSDADSPPSPQRVCHEVGARLGPADIVIGDGGDFVATAAHTLGLQWPQIWMDPGPLGTLGVGPGFGLAAKLSRPGARTVILFGDGAFGLHAMEFEAMVRQNIPVVAIIGNNAAWSQVRRGQIQLYGKERAVATALAYTRYDKVVEALGGRGFFVETAAQLAPALDEAFASSVPACVNVKLVAN